jgi:hypothetical protein
VLLLLLLLMLLVLVLVAGGWWLVAGVWFVCDVVVRRGDQGSSTNTCRAHNSTSRSAARSTQHQRRAPSAAHSA